MTDVIVWDEDENREEKELLLEVSTIKLEFNLNYHRAHSVSNHRRRTNDGESIYQLR